MSPLRWTTKSLRNLADEMIAEGFQIGYRKVGYLLGEMGYSLQKNQKMNQVGEEHPDRNTQFNHINEKVKTFGAAEYPVISYRLQEKRVCRQLSKCRSGIRTKEKSAESIRP